MLHLRLPKFSSEYLPFPFKRPLAIIHRLTTRPFAVSVSTTKIVRKPQKPLGASMSRVPFKSVQVRSSSFKSVQVRSSPFKSVQVRSGSVQVRSKSVQSIVPCQMAPQFTAVSLIFEPKVSLGFPHEIFGPIETFYHNYGFCRISTNNDEQ